jgi:four helix bundle protein
LESKELLGRTKAFALEVIKLVDGFPRTRASEIVGRQVLRSGTSIGASYRSARRSRSHAEFVSKMNVAMEEADESKYWLEIVAESGMASRNAIQHLIDEAGELNAIFTTSIKTARKRADV